MTRISQEAIQRAENTIRASQVLMQNADAIEAQCASAYHEEIVVAVVTPELIFGGAQLMPRNELGYYVRSLSQSSWALTFAPGNSREEIEKRLKDMAQIAQARSELMQKRINKEQTES